jgi:YceI-like domain
MEGMVMSYCLRFVAFVGAVLVLSTALAAETHPIDTARSKLTVHVYKSGLFSAFADNHIIQAPIASGSLSDTEPLAVKLVVRTSEMKVLDPDLAAAKRAEVQAGMVSEKVLDIAKYPEISFSSTMVTAAGADKWTVVGRLTIRGEARTISVPVVRQGGAYRGSVEIKQRDFGIEPISVAGGTVKVKDQLKIEFDIVARTN